MPRTKKRKPLKVLSRNSYRGRVMGCLPAFKSGRCKELTTQERFQVERVHEAISQLLNLMEPK